MSTVQTLFDADDIESAATCAWKEARGEGEEGMRGVLCVLKNRVGQPGFAEDLHGVIYGKNQFTSMSVPSDPEFNLQPAVNDEAFITATQMAKEIFGVYAPPELPGPPDITNGAHYYANLHNIDKNGWFYKEIVLATYGHQITAQIEHHTFFA